MGGLTAVRVITFNATDFQQSQLYHGIPWWSLLLVEENRVLGENQQSVDMLLNSDKLS